MIKNHRHASRSGWLTEQVKWEISRSTSKTGAKELIRESWESQPFLWSLAIHSSVFLTAWMAGVIELFPHIEMLHVQDPQAALSAAWQVLTAFASIAFAGLAILMQLTSEPVVTSRGVREVLFRDSHFRPILWFSIVGSAQLGVAVLLLDQPESAIVELVVVVATIHWIGWSYARVAKVYARPGEALRLGEKAILNDLRESLRTAHMRAVTESRLHDVVPREWRWGSTKPAEAVVLLSADRSGVLADLNINLLTDIKRIIASSAVSTFTASTTLGAPTESGQNTAPELRIMVSVGASVELGEEIFILKNSGSFAGNLDLLRRRLAASIRWEG